MAYTSFLRNRPYAESVDMAPGARTAVLSADNPLFAEVLAVALLQLGYATLPPRQPDEVHALLEDAGLVEHEQALYDAEDLEEWQPCLFTLRVPTRSELAQSVASPESAVRPPIMASAEAAVT